MKRVIIALLGWFVLVAATAVAHRPDEVSEYCTLLVRLSMGAKVYQCNTINCSCGGYQEACKYDLFTDEGGEFQTCACCTALPWGNGCLAKAYLGVPGGGGWTCQDVTCVGDCSQPAAGPSWQVFCQCQ